MTMVKPELLDYIKKQLSYGHDAPTIREHLLKHGYTETVADEALHAAVPFQKTKIPGLKYLPFSGKKMTIAFLVFVALGGLGFALFQMLAGGGDLAGAATERAEFQPPEELVHQNIEEEQETIEEEPEEIEAEEETTEEEFEETADETEESTDETEDTEEITEETSDENEAETSEESEDTLEEETSEEESEEETEEVVSASGCSGNNDCETGYVCYNKYCTIDNDRDSLSDEEEAEHDTDPRDQDSDDDGVFDADEIDDGTDALDAADPGYTSCSRNSDCGAGASCTKSGVCITCKDSDGVNYKKRGTTKGVHYTLTTGIYAQDNCNAAGDIVEYFCRSDGYFYSETTSCEDAVGPGYSCENGKCVEE